MNILNWKERKRQKNILRVTILNYYIYHFKVFCISNNSKTSKQINKHSALFTSSKLACFRRLDFGDGSKRCKKEKQRARRSPSQFLLIFFPLYDSLRSKRFCLIWEKRKTEVEERDPRLWPREKWNECQKMKEGGGGGEGRKLPFFPSPCPLFYLRHFSFFVPKPHGNACYAG